MRTVVEEERRDTTRRDIPEPRLVESRDDLSSPSLLDDDLIVPHLLGRTPTDDDHREETIEIVNITFLHE